VGANAQFSEDAVALVTGAGSGIGAACAHALAREGGAVVLTELPDRLDGAETVATEIAAGGGQARALPLDVRQTDSIERCVAEAAAWRGRIDVLVNNAGIAVRRPAFELSPDDWDAVLDVNLRGVFFVAQAVGRVMRDQVPQGGAIVNVASIMGLVGSTERAAYGASKGGVINLTRMLAAEWASLSIRVNAVCPTFVDTPLTRPMFDARPEFHAEVLHKTPLGRLATPDEVASAVVFLAGRGAAMVTGHALTVDGGWTAV
jgi:NAD(P)-dependent dehydrogenase (short-subunit alcohol dehydrogenase family)